MLEVPIILERWRAPDRDAVIALRSGHELTGGELTALAEGWRRRLGGGPPTDVALYFNDSFEAAAALLGAWAARRTVTLLGDAQSDTLRRLRAAAGDDIVFIGDLPGALPAPGPVHDASLPPLDPDFGGLIVYTSGSTGEPAAIPKTLRQLAAEVTTQLELWDVFRTAAAVVSTVSHQHIYGLLFRLLLPLAGGVPFAARRTDYPEEAQAAFGERPSVLVSSPAFLKRLPQSGGNAAAPILVFSSGGPLSADAARQAETLLGATVVEIYGSSETGGVAWRRQVRDEVWRALPGVHVEVRGECLHVRSPFIAEAGGFTTADRALLTGEDGFQLLGRADRLIKMEEKRISLTAIENALKSMDEVADARVVPLSGARTHLGAVVVPTAAGRDLLEGEGKRALNETLRRRLLDSVERIALPRYWRYVQTLPANSVGKTSEASLLALFETDDARRVPRVAGRRLEGARLTLDLIAQADLTWFEGHFPTAAILPGVALLQWVEYFGRRSFPLPPRFLRMEAIKFQHVVRPGTGLTMEIEWLEERASLSFRVHTGETPNASGRLVFGA